MVTDYKENDITSIDDVHSDGSLMMVMFSPAKVHGLFYVIIVKKHFAPPEILIFAISKADRPPQSRYVAIG